jgi:hypothetical protein
MKSNEKHGVWDPMAELNKCNITLGPLQNRLQHMYHSNHGLMNYKDNKPYMSAFLQLTC